MVSPKKTAKSSPSPKKKSAVGKIKKEDKSPKKKVEKNSTCNNDKNAEPPKKKTKNESSDIVTVRDATLRIECSSLEQFKIISWNVDGIRAPGRMEDFIAIVTEEAPDLICLQETKLQAPWDDDWKTSLPGYDAVWSSCTAKKGYAGTGVFYKSVHSIDGIQFGESVEETCSSSSSSKKKTSKLTSFFAPKKTGVPEEVPVLEKLASESTVEGMKERIISIKYGIDVPELDNEGRSITVEYNNFFVVNLYVPNSGMKLERLDYRLKEWNPSLENYIKKLELTKPVIVLGDLNVAHKDIDVYNCKAPHLKKQAGCTVEERKAFSDWLESGYVDAFRHIHGEAKGAYTYWSTRANNRLGNKGLRLDYFVVSQSMASQSPCQIVDSYVLDNTTKASDHAPVALVVARK